MIVRRFLLDQVTGTSRWPVAARCPGVQSWVVLGSPSPLRGRRAASVVLVLLLGAWVLLAALDRPSAANGAGRAFGPVGDAYVSAAAPRLNTSRQKRLVVAARPVRHAYLRFDVRGLSVRPAKA